MPRVGNKRFPYSPEGMRAAQAYSAQVGLPVERLDQDSPRNVYQSVTRSVQDRRRRRGENPVRSRGPEMNRGDRYGPSGYADETKREHYDRLWDRDWDEDWRGRKWDPRSSRA